MVETITVGRHQDNDKVFSNPKISKYHCVFFVYKKGNNPQVSVRDLNSKWGVVINSKRIRSGIDYELKEHDIVSIRLPDELPIHLRWKNWINPSDYFDDEIFIPGNDNDTIEYEIPENRVPWFTRLIKKISSWFNFFILGWIALSVLFNSCMPDFDNKPRSGSNPFHFPSISKFVKRIISYESNEKITELKQYYSITNNDSPIDLRNTIVNKYNVQKETNVYYNNSEKTLEYTLYYPTSNNNASSNKKKSLVIFLHQGAFIKGDKDDYIISQYCKDLAKSGIVAATIDYTLIRGDDIKEIKYWKLLANKKYVKSKIYQAVQDVHTAVSYFVDNADYWNIDDKRIFLAGYSAGALTSLMAAYSDDKEMKSFIGEDAYQILRCLDCKNHVGENINIDIYDNLAGVISLSGGIPNITDLPEQKGIPVLLIHGTEDDVISNGESFPFEFLRKEQNIDLPGFYMKLSIYENKDDISYEQYKRINAGAHIPKWIMKTLTNYFTFKIQGSRNIYTFYNEGSFFIEIKNGDHSFMINKDGQLNTNFRITKNKMISFINKYSNNEKSNNQKSFKNHKINPFKFLTKNAIIDL